MKSGLEIVQGKCKISGIKIEQPFRCERDPHGREDAGHGASNKRPETERLVNRNADAQSPDWTRIDSLYTSLHNRKCNECFLKTP